MRTRPRPKPLASRLHRSERAPSRASLLCLAPLLLLVACEPMRDNEAYLATIGEPCSDRHACAIDLACTHEGLCATLGAPGTAQLEEPCADTEDCRYGLHCTPKGLCASAQRQKTGARCSSDESCQESDRCDHSGRCAPAGDDGTAGEGEACLDTEDCGFGLLCGLDGLCDPQPPWAGVHCDDDPLASPTVYFRVDHGGQGEDFFKLPYPNDALIMGQGALDLSAFPGLDHGPAPATWLKRITASLQAERAGFGLNPTVYFRFSQPIDFDTLTFNDASATFRFVDITPGPYEGKQPNARFFASSERSPYICPNWLGIRPREGSPLKPGHRYAVFFRKGIKTTTGELLKADPDFTQLLLPSPPQDPVLMQPWLNYQPLRRWLQEQGIPHTELVGGTLFTTEDPTQRVRQAYETIHRAPAPLLNQLTPCDGRTPSPCGHGDLTRACGDPLNEGIYTEYHGLMSAVDLLTGFPPYAQWGGTILSDGDQLRPQGTAQVCVSVTIPQGAAPPGGWPVLIYVPDFGDHYRSAFVHGVNVHATNAGLAVVTLDPLLTGPRGGGTKALSAEEIALIHDDLSYAARARDLRVQGVAELFSLVRLISQPGGIPGLPALTQRAAQRMVLGYGHGAELSTALLAWEPEVGLGVLASAGGSTMDRLRVTRAPHRPAALLSQALADSSFNGMHPALHLAQHMLDPVDAMNHGALLNSPPEGVGRKHLLQLITLDDARTPVILQQALASAIGAPLFNNGQTLEPLRPAPPGVLQGNVQSDDGPRTQAVKIYPTGGAQAFFSAQGPLNDLLRFLKAAAEGSGPPAVLP